MQTCGKNVTRQNVASHYLCKLSGKRPLHGVYRIGSDCPLSLLPAKFQDSLATALPSLFLGNQSSPARHQPAYLKLNYTLLLQLCIAL